MTTRKKWAVAVALLASVPAFTACTNSAATVDDATPGEVTLLAYDAFTPAEGIFANFTIDTGAKVKVLTSGDAGTLVSKAILTAGNPEGDVLWGLDNTLLSRAKDADLLESYEPVDTGDICVNADKRWFSANKVPLPRTFEDLAQPAYKDLLVVEDPVASSPGLGFLLGTIAHFGEDGWRGYWRKLRDNGVRIAADWTTAYTVDFSGSAGKGDRPLVVSYGSSPPAEIVYATTPIDEPPTTVLESTCFRQVEYVGVLRGARNPNAGRKLVRFLLDVQFQESMPTTLFVFPVNPDAQLPDVFARWAVKPRDPLVLEPSVIAENRDAWLEAWRALML